MTGARALSGGVRVRARVVDPHDLSPDHIAAWREFQKASPALQSPYLAPEFCRIVGEVRGDVAVAVFEQGDRIAGFFPFQRRGRSGWPVGGVTSDCQAVLAAPWWRWDAREVVRDAGLPVYDFTHQRTEQEQFGRYQRDVYLSPMIDLTRGFPAYVEECRALGRQTPAGSSGLPHHTIARMRRVERQLGPLQFRMEEADSDALRRLLTWKSEQYRRTGVPDLFSRRWPVKMLERLHATRTADFAGVLSTLSIGGRMVAAHMGMRSASMLHWWFPAYDPAYAKFSPGLILLLELSRAAAESGIGWIELGPGDDPYKALVANGGLTVASGYVGPASLAVGYRMFRYAAADFTARLPIGRFARWPERLFRRLERIGELD